jgi:two-component system LytT family response regulator
MIRALVVDGDSASRNWILKHLGQEQDFEIIGECADGEDAIEKIGVLRPDVVFTEVEMRELSCFDILRSPNVTKRPYTIITTTSDRHAMQAFDSNVTDYLLKPLDYRRFKAALVKLRSTMDRDAHLERRVDLDQLMSYLKGNPQKSPVNRSADRVPVKFGRRYRFINMAAIRHIQAEGDYVNVHMVTGEIMHSGDRISEIERKLPMDRFLRVHRSVIINVEHVREVRADKSDYEIVMNSGQSFRPGTTYKTKVKKALIFGRHSRESTVPADSVKQSILTA